ncbi:MAG TPA: class I SAM-dependent methyltransferase [Phenylobacterium sp.]|uniref:class I SAM-dependent methyltransferase n=1 Tax=Phenylobacterium sp. TaxID=1871053 RepID=UPI002B494CE9|nr:class I SAM-dependent methyltransferase [Phenylobacterium sp.]HKR88481.1 class I SAM-dependent methyltransferase [Phenylobacterium sp.]
MSPDPAPSYAALTREDPNPLKRAVQGRRLADALRLAQDLSPGLVVDYGGGDGALCRSAAELWPQARVICFEPAPQLAAQAQALLAGVVQARVVEDESALPPEGADLVFCTEVFEHLPPAETARALDEIARVLRPGGHALIGVPVEIGPPALAKGIFRALRRPAEFDARPAVVLQALLGAPPRPRPVAEISAGRAYYPHHAGFDHRPLVQAIAARFELERRAGSPFPGLPAWLNSEVYVRARRRF